MIITQDSLLKEDESKVIDLFGIVDQVRMEQEKNPFFGAFFYLEDQQIVGYLFYSQIYERIELDQIEVIEEYRKRGIASKLLEALLAKAQEEKKKNITLEVNKENWKALKLYEKYGFKKVATRENYYQGVDGILMEWEAMK